MIRAPKHLGECEDTSCKFCHPLGEDQILSCCYGLRNTMGCRMEDVSICDREQELSALAMAAAITTSEDEDYHHVKDLAERRMRKVFNFVFEGHEYRASDSARAQNTCPHCGITTKDKRMFRDNSKEATYIGSVDFDSHTAECFECNTCFSKFFFHL